MVTINNIKFRPDTGKHLVAVKYLLEKKSKDTIIQELIAEKQLDLKKATTWANYYISDINKELERLGVQNTSDTSNTTQENHLHIHCKENKNKIVLFIKTDKRWEDWMKKTKECKAIYNLWGEGLSGNAYGGEMIDRSALDDLNKPILLQNSLNYAILRLKNISDGIEIPIKKNLVTKERLIDVLTDLSRKFDNFYTSKILKDKIEIEINVTPKKQ